MFTLFRMGLVVIGLILFMAAPVHAQVKTPEMKKLLKERSELLNEAMNIAMAHFKAGTMSIEDVQRLEKDAVKAALAFEDDPKERVAILGRSVETSQKIADIVDALFRAGTTTKLSVLRARASLLDARIELLKEEEKQKAAKPGK
jgi:outer membrane protein TolC